MSVLASKRDPAEVFGRGSPTSSLRDFVGIAFAARRCCLASVERWKVDQEGTSPSSAARTSAGQTSRIRVLGEIVAGEAGPDEVWRGVWDDFRNWLVTAA